jgi:hypothetical protein
LTGPTGSLERRAHCRSMGDEKAKNKAVFSYQFSAYPVVSTHRKL